MLGVRLGQKEVKVGAEIFGAEMWRGRLGVSLVDDDYRVPNTLSKVLEENDPFQRVVKIRNTYDVYLVPTKVNGLDFTIKKLQELMQSHGVTINIDDHTGNHGDIVDHTFKVTGAYWLFMAKSDRDVCPNPKQGKALKERYNLKIHEPTVLEAATIVALKALNGKLDNPQEKRFIMVCKSYNDFATRVRVDKTKTGKVSLTISIGDLHGGKSLLDSLETRRCLSLGPA